MSKIENERKDLNNTTSTQLTSTTSSSQQQNQKITLDQIASVLLKQNFILTALEFHTELAETGRELPRLKDYFSNPANFEQPLAQQQHHSSQSQFYSGTASLANSSYNNAGFYPLHKASSIQTFDSLDLTRYSDDVDQGKFQDDKICVLEFELRKAKETITQLRNTLTMATDPDILPKKLNSKFNGTNETLSEFSSSKTKEGKNKRINDNLIENNLNINNDQLSNMDVNNLTNNTMSLFNSGNNTTKTKTNESEESNSDEYIQEEDEADYLNLNAEKKLDEKNHKTNLMPHDKNVINFLINEYLLEQNYKMTHITFAEENELDLEDWDVVGLNRSKPPNLFQLYIYYLNKKNSNVISEKKELLAKECESKKVNPAPNTQTQTSFVEETTEIGVQTNLTEYKSISTNTNAIQTKEVESFANLDHDMFDNQKMQISKLLEKNEILVKSLAKLESEIETLSTERETNLKRIDVLSLDLEKACKNTSPVGSIEIKSETSELSTNSLKDINEKNKHEIPPERKIPIVFKEIVKKYLNDSYEKDDEIDVVNEIKSLKLTNDHVIYLLLKYLPIIAENVLSEKRIILIPLLLATSLIEKDYNSHPEYNLVKLLFNLIDKPNLRQRSVILDACSQFSKLAGPTCANNYLLPQCWEQLNDKNEEKRMLVAEACSKLAPFIYNDMRSSLMFSILKQIIEQEKCDSVRICAAQSLSILINYIKDEQKFIQSIELLDLCATDKNDQVIKQVETLMLPSICLWALSMGKLNEPLIMHLINKVEFYLLGSFKRNENENAIDYERNAKTYLNLVNLSLQFVLAFILVQFRETSSTNDHQLDEENTDYLSKLNNYFYLLQEKLNIRHDLYKLDSILEDYFHLTKKYLNLIETDSWSSSDLSIAFEWLSDKFLRKLMQICAQVDAKDPLCACFVQLFSNFVLIFAIDYELIRSKIVPIFEKLLNISENVESDTNQQQSIEQILNNKSCPLFKATLPVYFVGILSTLVDVETYGWLNMDFDNSSDHSLHSSSSFSFKSETSPSLFTNEKIINSTSSGTARKSKQETKSTPQSSLEKRIEHMNSYLKNLFFTLSLNQTNLDGLVAIYELMKIKSKSSEYVTQMLLSTLWDGIVHVSLYVRVNTAKLFEILVQNCDEYLLSTRILPALITLANDLDKMVRCSSISPLTSIIENCNNKEILERVYTQLQAFLSDPILKDEYLLQIELLKTFRRISTKVNSKFREELILPYLAILTMQIRNVINDNEYEFSLASFSSSLKLVNQQMSPRATISANSTMSNSSSSSFNSNRENVQQQQTQQQDTQKICALVFTIYQKLCLTTTNENSQHQNITISRQSIKESLIPGLLNLKDIFQNNIIHNSNNQNEYVTQLDLIINRLEHPNLKNESISTSSPINNLFLNNSNSHSLTPVSTHESQTKIVSNSTTIETSRNDILNTISNTSLSSINNTISGPFNVGTIVQNGTPENANFKSFVFKGITNLKDHSKDKFNFLLTNKTFKK